MAKRWLSVPIVGSGTFADPYRPDLPPSGIAGYVVGYYGTTECLVKAVRDNPGLDNARNRAGARFHGDEEAVTGLMGTTYRIAADVRAALVAEAWRLGAGADWRPEGYDVSES